MERKIVVYKEKHILEYWCDGQLQKTYRAGLSFAPVGSKIREGDGRVPEGEYYICTKNEQSKFTLFMGISYPNKGDAQRGLDDGLISQEEYDSIVDSIERGVRPTWETALGGKIGIHGMGSGFDWTAGCVALDDDDVRDLWQYMEKGDIVIIHP